jgi:hypothetical protein
MGNYEVQVINVSTWLWVRTGPSTSYGTVNKLYNGNTVTSSKQSNGWYYIDSKGGWSSGQYLKVTKNLDPAAQPAVSVPVPTTANEVTTEANSTGTSLAIDAQVIAMLVASSQAKAKTIDASMRLFGTPFQFTKQTDFRLTGGEYDLGRKYLETIVAESPIVYFLPGRPNFLPNSSDDERNAFKSYFAAQLKGDNDNSTLLDKIFGNQDVRYFDFLADYSTYIQYVNLLCRTAAIYMGLGDYDAPIESGTTRTKYRWFNWSNYRYADSFKTTKESKKSIFDLTVSDATQMAYEAAFGKYQYTQFYVDPSTSFSESSSNSTAQSKLAQTIKSGEDAFKEIVFFTQAAGSSGTWAQSAGDTLKSAMDKFGSGIFSRLGDASSTIISGANMMFPEIWGDSNYNKSYNITINLVSPYGDKESIYLNIIVPLMHLIALSLPRQISANSFTNPFLVKVSSKGWFSCEMGMIDSISIEKVQESWSVDGLPTEVKVHISIRDLYSSLMITSSNQPQLFYENKGLMNWLAVTCGMDVTTPAMQEKWNALVYSLLNKYVDIPGNTYTSVLETVRNYISKLW